MVKGELLWLPELWNILEIINVFSSFRSTYGQIIPTLHERERACCSKQEINLIRSTPTFQRNSTNTSGSMYLIG